MPDPHIAPPQGVDPVPQLDMPKTVLVLGGSGQIGRCMLAELQQHLPPEVLSQGRLLSPSRAELDLSDGPAVLRYLQQWQPDWLINCASYTAVDAAEQDPRFAQDRFAQDSQLSSGQLPLESVDSESLNYVVEDAVDQDGVDSHPNTLLNAMLPKILAQYWQASCKPLTLLHYSTDYVYSGQGDQPWREHDLPAPINAYGRAKAAGDQALLAALHGSPYTDATSASRLYIVRTSWVYHSQGHNFINTILRLAGERDVLRVVDDQVGAPTPATWAAQMSRLLLQGVAASGLYHLVPSGVTSWYGVAYAALSNAARAGRISQVPALVAIESREYPTPAKRPLNSRLDCQKLQQALGLEFPDWQVLLRQQIGPVSSPRADGAGSATDE